MLIGSAETSLFARARSAFGAATEAGLPGTFVAVEHAGLLATVTTATGLTFLNVVSGLTARTVDAVPDVLDTFAAAGVGSPFLVVPGPDQDVDPRLAGWGFVPAGPRPLACLDLDGLSDGPDGDLRRVRDARERAVFLDVLVAGYDAPEPISRFIRTEHAVAALPAFLAWHDGEPVAAAAMSVQGDVAVLGAATVLPAARGQGWQVRLLRHRLHAARAAGCTGAVATAAPRSASMANLVRTGFTVHARQAWRAPLVDR